MSPLTTDKPCSSTPRLLGGYTFAIPLSVYYIIIYGINAKKRFGDKAIVVVYSEEKFKDSNVHLASVGDTSQSF
jgi:hypothetical protein